jgi:hypothetical protein
MLKKIYGGYLSFLTALCGIDFAKRMDAWLRFRRKLNLKNPQTLSDKVTYLFLHKSTALVSACTDKWAVREYIARKELADILIPAAGGPWNKAQDIDFEALPARFILKATHGCKMNYLVTDKNKLDVPACKRTLQTWLNTTYGTYSLEPHYRSITPRVYAEKLLDAPGGLADYKIHCLNGVPQFILVCSERNAQGSRMQVKLDLFDTQWNCLNRFLQPSGLETAGSGRQEKPQLLEKMLAVSRTLSADFPFVRVDLYEVDGKIYFGELTFSPACGVFPYFTDEFIAQTGQQLKI